LAELELAFNGVRRVHTMGLFYTHRNKEGLMSRGFATLPQCNGHLGYPRIAIQLLKDLKGRGALTCKRCEESPGSDKVPERRHVTDQFCGVLSRGCSSSVTLIFVYSPEPQLGSRY